MGDFIGYEPEAVSSGGSFNPAVPGPIGGTTPSTVNATTITATSQLISPTAGINSARQNSFPATSGKTFATTDQLTIFQQGTIQLSAGLATVTGINKTSASLGFCQNIGGSGVIGGGYQVSLGGTNGTGTGTLSIASLIANSAVAVQAGDGSMMAWFVVG